MKPTVAIYAIVKDEAERIGRMLDSTLDADLVVILDTGSTDATYDIANAYEHTALHRAAIQPWRYDTGRNVALALVPSTIDICLRLDADEVLCEGWRAAVDEAVANADVSRWRYPQITDIASAWWGKVVRNDLHRRHGFFWRYPTHEILDGPDSNGPWAEGLWVDHLPDERKPRPNLEILRAEAARDPHDHRIAFYFARELMYSGDWPAARRQFWRFLEMPHGWNVERGEAYRHLAEIDVHTEQWLWKAIAEDQARREPYVDLARHYADRTLWDEAAALLMLAERRTDDTRYTTDKRAWGAGFDALKHRIINKVPNREENRETAQSQSG